MSVVESGSQQKPQHPESSEEIKNADLELKNTIFPPLLALPDDVLLNVFRYLDPVDLVNLSRSCERINVVARDRTLWSKVDLRSQSVPLCQLKELAEYLLPTTKFFASRGCLRFCKSILCYHNCSPVMMKMISERCPNLETLILEEHCFHARKFSVKDLPSSLKSLTLKNCETYVDGFLPIDGIDEHMPNLEVLVVDGTASFTLKSCISLSKCPNLRELRIRSSSDIMIDHLNTCIIDAQPDCFKALKIFEVCGKVFTDTDLHSLNTEELSD